MIESLPSSQEALNLFSGEEEGEEEGGRETNLEDVKNRKHS